MRGLTTIPRLARALQSLSSQAGVASGSVTSTWSQPKDAPTSSQSAARHYSVGSKRSWLHTAVMPQEQQAWDEPSTSSRSSSSASHVNVDPFSIVHTEVGSISERLRHSVTSTIPVLRKAAEYFFRPGVEGKRLRPTLIMLMASALSSEPPPLDCLGVDNRPANVRAPEPRRRQQRVAEIAELIHVASLLHDDVLDDAVTRRGVASVNEIMGNKTAILAGDFLLARASVTLASLDNNEIVELMSAVLEHLVSGEIMQMTATNEQRQDLEHYLQKTYCKTASLMANSARSVAVVAGHGKQVCDLAWGYGRHLGLAFQIVDDVLDLTASSSILGKPALNDMKSGLATAPVLFAAEEQPALRPLIARKFKQEGDVAQAMSLIERSAGIQRAKELAQHHAAMAAQMINSLPAATHEHATLSRHGLLAVTQLVLNRKK